MSQDTFEVFSYGFGEIHQHPHTGLFGSQYPAYDKRLRFGFRFLRPHPTQFLFEAICGGQWPVNMKCIQQSLFFIFPALKVFRIFQEYPTTALQGFFFKTSVVSLYGPRRSCASLSLKSLIA